MILYGDAMGIDSEYRSANINHFPFDDDSKDEFLKDEYLIIDNTKDQNVDPLSEFLIVERESSNDEECSRTDHFQQLYATMYKIKEALNNSNTLQLLSKNDNVNDIKNKIEPAIK